MNKKAASVNVIGSRLIKKITQKYLQNQNMEKKGTAQELCTVLCAKSISFNSKYHNLTEWIYNKVQRITTKY